MHREEYTQTLDLKKCFRTEIEGLRVHFVRSAFEDTYKKIIPLLLLHDWTTSFWSYYKVFLCHFYSSELYFHTSQTAMFSRHFRTV